MVMIEQNIDFECSVEIPVLGYPDLKTVVFYNNV